MKKNIRVSEPSPEIQHTSFQDENYVAECP